MPLPRMSSASGMNHPGLLFATLVVQLVMAKGLPFLAVGRRSCPECDENVEELISTVINFPQVSPRHKGGEEGCDPDDHCTSSTGPTNTPTGGVNGTNTANTTPPPSTPLPLQPPTPASTTIAPATSTTTTPATSTTPPPPAQTNDQQQAPPTVSRNMNITTGGIIGVAFGAVVIAGLAFILFGMYYRRRSRARNHPQAQIPPMYLGPPPPFDAQFPAQEMSQTQSSPLVSSAIASRITSSPPQHYPHSMTTTSLSPLIPATTLEHSPSLTSSSNRRASLSYTDGGSSQHTAPHSAHEMSNSSTGPNYITNSSAVGGLAGIILGSTVLPTPPSEPSGLVRAMTAYQKSLEAEDQKISQIGPSTSSSNSKEEEQDITDSHDPPPRYDA